MYGTPAQLLIGFHACEKRVGEKVLAGKDHLRPSENSYDWLGWGRYFWEGNLDRAWKYAEQLSKRKKKPRLQTPFVIGAVIDLGYCLNLLEARTSSC